MQTHETEGEGISFCLSLSSRGDLYLLPPLSSHSISQELNFCFNVNLLMQTSVREP